MIRGKVRVVDAVGLHARPAANFVRAASGFECRIWVETDSGRADAKSLLMILTLGVTQDSEITIVADGADEEMAVACLIDLVQSGLAEGA